MGRIYVAFSGIEQMSKDCASIQSQLEQIKDSCQAATSQLDWEVRFEPEIAHAVSQLTRRLENEIQALKGFQQFLQQAYTTYEEIEGDSSGEKIGKSLSQTAPAVPVPGSVTEPDPKLQDQGIEGLKGILKFLDKSGASPQAGIAGDGLSYWQALERYFSGDKTGLTGASNWLNLTDKSAGLWKGFYDYLKEFYPEIGPFSVANQTKAAGVGVIGDTMGLAGAIFGAADTIQNTEGIGPAGITGEVLGVGGSVVDLASSIYQMANPGAALSGGLFSPVSIYSSIAEAFLDTAGQGFKSYEQYSADGVWDTNDTAYTLIDSSSAGIYSLGNFFSFGTIAAHGITAEDVSNGMKTFATDLGHEIGDFFNDMGSRGANYILEHPDLLQQYQDASELERNFIAFFAAAKSLQEK